MPTGDFPPPKGMMWTDACGWVPISTIIGPMEQLGREFEQPIFDNIWDLYVRDEKPALWFWGT